MGKLWVNEEAEGGERVRACIAVSVRRTGEAGPAGSDSGSFKGSECRGFPGCLTSSPGRLGSGEMGN